MILSFWRANRRFIKFLWPHRKAMAGYLLLGSGGMAISLVIPYISKRIIDEAIAGRDMKLFFFLMAAAGSCYVFSEALTRASQYGYETLRMRVRFDIHRALFRKLGHMDLSWFQDRATGEHMYKMDFDADAVTNLIVATLPKFILAPVRLLVLWGIVFFVNPVMALLTFVFLPLWALPLFVFNRWIRRAWTKTVEAGEAVVVRMQEILSRMPMIKVFGQEAFGARQFLKYLARSTRLSIDSSRRELISSFVMDAISKFLLAGLVSFGVWQVIRGRTTLGALSAVLVYLHQLVEAQAELGRMAREVTESSFSCERVAQILDEPIRMVSQPTSLPVVLQEGCIVFEGVGFGYAKDKRQSVFEGIGATIPGGAFVALAGVSGCGKTTLCYLIARLFDPRQGRVLIDGCDVRQMDITFLKEQMGMALQETFLWNDTIAANIRYGRPQASREEVRHAGRLAGVEAMAAGMPQGYEAVIGENACKISEGQKQKIAIARALVKKPRILILDEAMSHMDSLSEEKILADIRRTYPEMTLIVVSHRLSCVLQADTVFYLKSSSEIISASGRELLEKDRDFAALFGGQAG